jgi:hypothetical protein
VSAGAARRRPLKVTFVGQSVYFAHCALQEPADGIEPSFVDFRAGAPAGPMLARVRELSPDVVLVFRPEIVPPGLFADLDVVRIGYLTEPLPRTGEDEHPDLQGRLWWLEQVDPGNFDRVISFDPLIAQTAERFIPVWRSLPIPVADGLFMALRPRSRPPRLLFLGRSTEHREAMLAPVKQRQAVVHIGHGLFGAALKRTLAEADVQLNLHNNPYPSFENRVCIALAAGHLVISEPLSPEHGLVPGRDFVEVGSPEELEEVAQRLGVEPEAFADIQAAGREQAERFRASRVYPELFADALAELGRAELSG